MIHPSIHPSIHPPTHHCKETTSRRLSSSQFSSYGVDRLSAATRKPKPFLRVASVAEMFFFGWSVLVDPLDLVGKSLEARRRVLSAFWSCFRPSCVSLHHRDYVADCDGENRRQVCRPFSVCSILIELLEGDALEVKISFCVSIVVNETVLLEQALSFAFGSRENSSRENSDTAEYRTVR
jgi:hypothetical protein